MTENAIPAGPVSANPDRYKTLVVVLTVLTTVFAAVLAALQADASIRSDQANRDSQFYAIATSGELHRAGLTSNYDVAIFGEYLKDQQEATVLQLTALEERQRGDPALITELLAQVAQARADTGKKFTVLFSDARYAPKSEDGAPDLEAYLGDSQEKVNDLLVVQNRAADQYHYWNRKSDRYVTVLTLLSVAFFLFGVAQAVKNPRLRLTFAIFGMVVVGSSGLLALFNLLR